MATVSIAIGSPILTPPDTVHIVVRNSAGGLIRESDEGNDPFSITGLAPDDYTMTVTNGTNTTVECFTIEPCGCPIVADAEIIQRGTSGIYDLIFTFDLSTYQPTPDCAFGMFVFSGGSGFIRSFSNLSGFTDIGGGLYTYTAFLGYRSSITYRIFKTSAPVYAEGETCVPDTFVNYECIGPLYSYPITNTPPDISVSFDGTQHTLNIDYRDCGGSCDEITWNYLQKGIYSYTGLIPDSGTFTDTVACSPLSSSSHVIHPNINPYSSGSIYRGFSYDILGTDCCGNTYTTTITCDQNIVSANIVFVALAPSSTLSYRYLSCGTGGGCGGAMTMYISYMQVFVVGGNTPDSGSYTDVINCGALPDIRTHMVSPAPSTALGGTEAVYLVTFKNCCGFTIQQYNVRMSYP